MKRDSCEDISRQEDIKPSLSLSAINKMNPDIEPVVLANSKFSIDLLKQLCKENPDNVLFSALSVSSALGLVLLGAGGNTAEQMYKALHFGSMRIMYHYLFEEIYREGEDKIMDHGQNKRSLQLLNRLFGENTVHFKDEFLDDCEEWCFASFRNTDFKTDPEAVRKQINSWVEKKTSDEMKDLLGEGDVSKDTSLALISAVYFNKKWVNGFTSVDPKQVKGVNWPMMGKRDNLPLGTIPHRQYQLPTEAQILEIPYENNHLSMLVLLPNESDGLPKLLDSITYEKVLEWTEPDNMILTDVSVEMPSFTLQEKYDLEKTLKALGVTELFSDKCDLSGMAPGLLKLSKVVHKSVVEVNTEGTNAQAGGGGVVQTLKSCRVQDSFIVDHPFLFFIRHNPTKSIIFWGRVTSPSL